MLGFDSVRQSVQIRRRVGYLPGGIALYDSLSGERLLDYLGGLTGRPSTRRAALLDRLELSERTMQRPVRDYSRGMRQKIGIIQALQHDPDLAILDEPTEGLDPLMQRAFYDILGDLKRVGRTIFFSSHQIAVSTTQSAKPVHERQSMGENARRRQMERSGKTTASPSASNRRGALA